MDLGKLHHIRYIYMEVYDALSRAQNLAAEGERLRQKADELLRQSNIAYLVNGTATVFPKTAEQDDIPDQMVASDLHIQQAYSALKDAFYREAQAKFSASLWNEAVTLFSILERIEPGYRDTSHLCHLARKKILEKAKAEYTRKDWDAVEKTLQECLSPSDIEQILRLKYIYDDPINIQQLVKDFPQVQNSDIWKNHNANLMRWDNNFQIILKQFPNMSVEELGSAANTYGQTAKKFECDFHKALKKEFANLVFFSFETRVDISQT